MLTAKFGEIGPERQLRLILRWILMTLLGGAFSGCMLSQDVDPSQPSLPYKLELLSWQIPPNTEFMDRGEVRRLATTNLVSQLPPIASSSVQATLLLSGRLETDDTERTLLLEAHIRFPDQKVPLETGILASRTNSGKDGNDELMNKTMDDLSRALVALVRLYKGSKANWMSALNSPEPDEQILAIRLLAHEQVSAAALPLAQLLGDPRQQVAEEAAAALGQLGNPQSVPWIIETARNGSLQVEVRCIESLGAIGGPEAIAYLEMIAGGHENQEVRRISLNALKRLKNGR